MKDETKHRPENDRQKAALEYYYGLGYKRNYAAVAEKFKVSIRTVKYWSSIYTWRERVDQMDMEQIQTLKMSLDPSAIKTDERLLQLVRAVKAWTVKCLSGGKQNPTVRELISLMKARLEAGELLNGMRARQATADVGCVVRIDSGKKSGGL